MIDSTDSNLLCRTAEKAISVSLFVSPSFSSNSWLPIIILEPPGLLPEPIQDVLGGTGADLKEILPNPEPEPPLGYRAGDVIL